MSLSHSNRFASFDADGDLIALVAEGLPEWPADNDLSPIYKPTHELYEGKAGRIYGGCYVNAQVELWGQKAPAPEGLRCALMVVQRLRDGDSFGGGSVTDAGAFGEVTDGAAADDLS